VVTHLIKVDEHELAVLNHIISTYETVITNVKYSKWSKTEALQDLANIKLTVSSAQKTLKFRDQE
jgi:ATP phosphoribosyltransferase